MLPFILIIAIALVAIASFGISSLVYRSLVRAGNSSANVLRVVTFIVSFLIILIGIGALILANIRLER